MKSIQKPIVIVGAGFAAMTFALNLKNLNPSLPILVVDSETNFIFKPLMYEVLSIEIRIWEATPKFANIFSEAGITFLRNSLNKITFKENILEFSDDLKLSYQYLVICTGSIPNSFFKCKANVIPAKPAPTITIGFCIDFISEILLCVNVLLNYTNNF